MIGFNDFSLTTSVIIFISTAVVIGLAGVKLTYITDRIADKSGIGEALTGALFLGASTSLSGIVTSLTAAIKSYPELAVSNALGGIAAQTAFLAIADIVYRKANLEHAAASQLNMLQGTLLIIMLCLPLIAISTPVVTFFEIHPVTPTMLIVYIYGMLLIAKAKNEPMWHPEFTRETKEDVPEEIKDEKTLATMWVYFSGLAIIVGAAGWIVANSGVVISNKTGLTETAVGALFTAVATSLPELVTSIAAVNRGALTLAVGGIIGGNAFDTLFLAVSDIGFRKGSIYHAITEQQVFLISLSIILTGILILGMIRRERHGIVNIGFESFLVLVLYLFSIIYIVFK